ncbi:unnamed protein product [Gulo gulo]|uniref:Uncharacterized protein n=1 Tax=Gulo gulo TaxID=48420 RepID=A0A9X9LED1_GULGU|nr:unnamed protein product [Gulo gulo]
MRDSKSCGCVSMMFCLPHPLASLPGGNLPTDCQELINLLTWDHNCSCLVRCCVAQEG